MPCYEFKCASDHTFTTIMTFTRYEAVKEGTEAVLCDTCGEPASPSFNPSSIGFTMREGTTGGWATKSNKENRYRQWRSNEMARRTREHVRPVDLVPNYQGQTHDRWSDVRDHVHIKEGAGAASTYDGHVAKEKSK